MSGLKWEEGSFFVERQINACLQSIFPAIQGEDTTPYEKNVPYFTDFTKILLFFVVIAFS